MGAVALLVLLVSMMQDNNSGINNAAQNSLQMGVSASSQLVIVAFMYNRCGASSLIEAKQTGHAEQLAKANIISPVASRHSQARDNITSAVASHHAQTRKAVISPVASGHSQARDTITSAVASQHAKTRKTVISPVASGHSQTRENITSPVVSQHTQTRETINPPVASQHDATTRETITSAVASLHTPTRENISILIRERRGFDLKGFLKKHVSGAAGQEALQNWVTPPFFYTGPIPERVLMPHENCDALFCKQSSGRYSVNTKYCSTREGSPKIYLTVNSSVTLELLTDPVSGGGPTQTAVCQWDVYNPQGSTVNVTVDRLKGLHSPVNLTLTISQIEGNRRVSPGSILVDGATLTERSLSFATSSTLPFRHRFLNDVLRPTVVTLHYVTQIGLYVHELPFVKTSESMGYVTSPGFDTGENYPDSYDGEFKMNVADTQSLLFTFNHFHVRDGGFWGCLFHYLALTVDNETRRKMCGNTGAAPLQMARSSLRLHFHTSQSETEAGFKMTYLLVPRDQEPQRMPNNRINCSVAHFPIFQPLVACNTLVDCQGAEDERDCPDREEERVIYTECTVLKCYRLYRLPAAVSWWDAKDQCLEKGQTLALVHNEQDHKLLTELSEKRPVKSKAFFYGVQKLGRVTVSMTHMYTNVWSWADGRSSFTMQPKLPIPRSQCGAIYQNHQYKGINCREIKLSDFACEWHSSSQFDPFPEARINEVKLTNQTWNVTVAQCPLGHVTRDFLSCDALAQCGAVEAQRECSAEGVTLPMFACQGGGATVPFSLVCDHVTHCPDKSDEDFCHHPACPHSSMRCRNGQCFHIKELCDGKVQCLDWTDESCTVTIPSMKISAAKFPPSIVYMGSKGINRTKLVEGCPVTHFQCPGDFCLPLYLRCNGVEDCRGRQDEMGCDSYTCPGFFRCRGSRVCLHADDVCDGVPQCPQQDDELLCDLSCPDACRCQGLAFVCSLHFSARSYPDIRYLDVTGSGMKPADVSENWYLVYLRMSANDINNVLLNLTLPNLKELDLSWNQLTTIDMHIFSFMDNLQVLDLTGNPLVHVTNSQPSGSDSMSVERIVLSLTDLDVYDGRAFASNPLVRTLNFSGSKLEIITKEGFQTAPRLEILDARDTFLKDFPPDLLRNLAALKEVHADNYKLCCQAMLPVDFKPRNCHAPHDLLTSCEDLLRSNTYRVFLWVLACMSIVGNAGSFVGRVYLQRGGEKLSSFSVFVTNLCVADFLKGVYLFVIGVADQVYLGRYLWYDDEWKGGLVCQTAGFLSLLSSETSAFVICLITLDRVLVLCFPFSRFHFRRRSAIVTSAVAWAACLCLAAVPLLPGVRHWGFYSQTGICLPLPFSGRGRFEGYDYFLGVMILLNLVIFLFIAAGQAVIQRTVLTNTLSSSADNRTRDATLARRVNTVVVSDFLCWFPVGLLGLLAATGTRIPGEVNVAVAIFVMPLNAALNPYLYTGNVLMEKRRKLREATLTQQWESRLQTELSKTEARRRKAAVNQVRSWLSQQLFKLGDI